MSDRREQQALGIELDRHEGDALDPILCEDDEADLPPLWSPSHQAVADAYATVDTEMNAERRARKPLRAA